MSRTWKDAPYKVRQKRMMEKGVFDHDHQLGVFDSDRTYTRTEEVRFKKVDAKEIYAFRQELIANDEDFTENEESKVIKYISDDVYLWRGWISEKYIVFTITKTIVRKSRISKYCTDAEHFDVSTGNDTRDGKIARCAPFPPSSGKRSGYCCFFCDYTLPEIAKINRKARFNNVAKAYNNGMSEEDLDELKDLYDGALYRN